MAVRASSRSRPARVSRYSTLPGWRVMTRRSTSPAASSSRSRLQHRRSDIPGTALTIALKRIGPDISIQRIAPVQRLPISSTVSWYSGHATDVSPCVLDVAWPCAARARDTAT